MSGAVHAARKRRCIVTGLATLLMAGSGAMAQAATLNVSTTSDNTTNDSFCSLREAILAANLTPANTNCGTAGSGSNTINLPAGTYVVSVNTPLDVTRTVTIQGSSMWTTTIRADLTAFHAVGVQAPAGNLTIKDVTLTKGTQSAGVTGIVIDPGRAATLDHVQVSNFNRRGIFNNVGVLTITSSTIANNWNDENGGGIAVFSDESGGSGSGVIVMDKSTVVGNSAVSGNGGGIFRVSNGTDNTTSISNSTFSDNHADLRGGAIFSVAATGQAAYMALYHLTIAHNSAGNSGGGITEDFSAAPSIQCTSSIINDNSAPAAADVEGEFFTDWCIVTNVDDLYTGWHDTSRVGAGFNARLGPLMYAGGPTQVFPLTPQPPPLPSPAIDFGSSTDGFTVDQRGYVRPKNGNGGPTPLDDVGAYEYDPAATTFESENEPMLAKSSDAFTVVTGSSYSNGKGVNLASNASGDFVTFPIGVLVDGTYNVKVRVKKGTNEGIFKLTRSTTLGGAQTLIAQNQDLWATSNTWVELNLGNTALTSGQAFFTFTVTGQNTHSSSAQLFIDYVKLTKQ